MHTGCYIIISALLLFSVLMFAVGYLLGRHFGYAAGLTEGLAEGKRSHFENAMHFLTKSINK